MFMAEGSDGFTAFVLGAGLVGLCIMAIPGALALRKGHPVVATILFGVSGVVLLGTVAHAVIVPDVSVAAAGLPSTALWVAQMIWALILPDTAAKTEVLAKTQQALKDFELAEAKRRWEAKKRREASHASERGGERPR